MDSDRPILHTERTPGAGAGDGRGDTSESDGHFSEAVTAVTAAFGDPTRREIYLFVRSNPGTTASEVAARFSLHPNVARHHLERLATGGYVEITMERGGRSWRGFFPVGGRKRRRPAIQARPGRRQRPDPRPLHPTG